MTSKIYFHVQEIKTGVDKGCQYLEECFDGAGKIPYLSTVSGGIRFAYGTAQIAAALALTIIWRIAAHYADAENQPEFRKEATEILDYAIHGAANMVRGYIECFRWVNLFFILYDKFLEGEKLHLRLNYSRHFEIFQFMGI
jgi:hypothetical protein